MLELYGGGYNNQYWGKHDKFPCPENIFEHIFKMRENVDIIGIGDSGSKLHGKGGGSILGQLWEQKEFAHERESVKVPSLRGNAEWKMQSGACLPDLIKMCEESLAKRRGEHKMYGMYDVAIIQYYGNDMFPNSNSRRCRRASMIISRNLSKS